ncbi:hypothetical protein [Sphingomonas sp. VNH70]|uniref:hypothetical protein n=1 Tax=Sphingomonas silueang TaxID=3156617 RepID=UPI0032B59633
MSSVFVRQPPRWFRIVAVLLVLWGFAGIAAFYYHATMGDAALSTLTEYERRFYFARPGWFDWVYATATWSGLFGALALVVRRRIAAGLFALSLLAVAVQFGWVFAATDLIAVKGAPATVPFPLLIFVIALGQLALARHAVARGWLR